jgi:hypothetical protein
MQQLSLALRPTLPTVAVVTNDVVQVLADLLLEAVEAGQKEASHEQQDHD